jgi:hypothetical protein
MYIVFMGQPLIRDSKSKVLQLIHIEGIGLKCMTHLIKVLRSSLIDFQLERRRSGEEDLLPT